MSWLIIIFVTNLFENTRQMSIHMLFALIVATLVGQITIKSIVRRKRPCHTYQDVQILVPVPSDLSFPSGHTTSSFACSTVLFCYHPLLGLIGYTYAALTAISRVYLFVHYLMLYLTKKKVLLHVHLRFLMLWHLLYHERWKKFCLMF